MGDQELNEPPKYGLKLKLNHIYPIDSKQIIRPKPKQILDFVPLTTRYLSYYMGRMMHHKRPIMDYVHTLDAERKLGCPLGGMGGGTIGRGFKGEFCRFQLYPGLYEYVTVPECQFIVNIRNAADETIFQSVLSTYDKPKNAPASWEWNLNGGDCEYTALYPRAWTTYDLTKYGVHLTCRQISPVIPHNYKDSSLPCAVFVFTAKNVSKEQRSVSITFTWTELTPYKSKSPKKDNHVERYTKENTCGVSLEQKIAGLPCTYTIAKLSDEHETIFENYCTFNAAKESKYLWECLKKKGALEPDATTQQERKEKGHGKHATLPDSIGLSSAMSLDPGGSGEAEFCLVWDMPVIKFKKEGRFQRRYYTKYFGSDGIAGPTIAKYALDEFNNWEKQIAKWQDPILTNRNIPDWLKSALMNELYFVADGGTIWFTADEEYPRSDPRHDFGVFGYLEGHEYRMYNTYDVHFYASFALAQLWPNLQVVVQYMFRETISLQTEKCRKSLYDGKSVPYKVKDSIPHDLGDPQGEPFKLINAYNVHDVSEWRDLNVKFILQVMRDYRLLKSHSAPFDNERYRSLQYIDDVRDGTEDQLYVRSTIDYVRAEETPSSSRSETPTPANPSPPAGNILEMLYRGEAADGASGRAASGERSDAAWDARRYLADMYGACAALLRRMLRWDADGDGLIENSGWPDQTYDSWVMTGPSAYCGSLWIAAVSSVRAMARILGEQEDEKEFAALLDKAKASFEEKLWCGTHYRFDASSKQRVVMSDQLAGQWYLRACGLTDDLFPEANVRKALRTVYENNVLKFGNGKMGAVNGYLMAEKGKPGHVDESSLQSMEMWTGVTYSVAALMIFEGMHEEAFATAGGMYTTLTQMGLSFETPEALYENGHHRSVAYMRPLSIWAMYQAITARPPPPKPAAMANGQSRKPSL